MSTKENQFKEKHNYHIATPVIKQYLDVKAKHIDHLVLFRMGDFYELFYEDASIASRTLGITLTKRGKGASEQIPMCGVPYHAIENYLNKMLDSGFKVVICEQLETPDEAKKRGGSKAVVKRDITRIITPGTIIEDSLLNTQQPNYLCSITVIKDIYGLCIVDLSTSEIIIISLPKSEIINQL